jgi:hypothetical protein
MSELAESPENLQLKGTPPKLSTFKLEESLTSTGKLEFSFSVCSMSKFSIPASLLSLEHDADDIFLKKGPYDIIHCEFFAFRRVKDGR